MTSQLTVASQLTMIPRSQIFYGILSDQNYLPIYDPDTGTHVQTVNGPQGSVVTTLIHRKCWIFYPLLVLHLYNELQEISSVCSSIQLGDIMGSFLHHVKFFTILGKILQSTQNQFKNIFNSEFNFTGIILKL